MKKSTLLFSIILLFTFSIFAQKSKNSWAEDHLRFTGYVKYMNMLSFTDGNDLLTDNLLHNRINLKAYLSNPLTFNASMRNRVFYGDRLKVIPQYPDFIDANQDMMDLSFFPFKKNRIFMHSTFDRLNFNYSSGYWDITIGRQRINWGINTVWNPNDLFNTNNFLDFDYEEKSGADAIRIQYFTGDMSSFELAYHPNKDFEGDKSVLAALYKFNFKSFDMQFLTAKYYTDYSFGMGFAGNLKNAGIKGELNYFKTKEENQKDALVGSVSVDYGFKNGIYWMASALYNGNYQENTDLSFFNLFSNQLTARNLFPSQYAFFTQLSGNFGPAWSWSTGGMFGTDNKLFILMPSLAYSMTDNWEINLTSQVFFSELPQMEQQNLVYLRFRYSF